MMNMLATPSLRKRYKNIISDT